MSTLPADHVGLVEAEVVIADAAPASVDHHLHHVRLAGADQPDSLYVCESRPLVPVAARVQLAAVAAAVGGRREVIIVPVPALQEGVVRGQPGEPGE